MSSGLLNIQSRFARCRTGVLLCLLLGLALVSCGKKPDPPSPFERYSNRVYTDLQAQTSTRLIGGAYNVKNIHWVSRRIEKQGTQYRMIITGDWAWHGDWSDSRSLRFEMTTLHAYENSQFTLIPTSFMKITSSEETYDVEQKQEIIDGMKQAILNEITQINEQIKLQNILYEPIETP